MHYFRNLLKFVPVNNCSPKVCTFPSLNGLIIKANIPVQELEGQRGEGAYLWEDMGTYSCMYAPIHTRILT